VGDLRDLLGYSRVVGQQEVIRPVPKFARHSGTYGPSLVETKKRVIGDPLLLVNGIRLSAI
jgi:hypothetical protein